MGIRIPHMLSYIKSVKDGATNDVCQGVDAAGIPRAAAVMSEVHRSLGRTCLHS